MIDRPFHLATCPIVEAVIDIRCDMPPSFNLGALEPMARDAFRSRYPKFRPQFVEEHRVELHGGEPPTLSARHGIGAFQFFGEDERELVQMRPQGYSFSRLAPYTSLDDYLPEIERAWKLFADLTAPVQIREIRLRYINRLLLPLEDGKLEFNDYLKVGPRLPDDETLTLAGFFTQHAAVEVETGHRANIIMTLQPSEKAQLPLIFDIEVSASGKVEPSDWNWIRTKIDSLRTLKNRVFKNTLTERCLNLYSPSEF